DVLLVIRIPKSVMHSVQANIHIVEVVPFLLRNQVTDHLPMLAAHGEDLLLEPGFVVGTKTGYVSGIVSDQFCNFLFDLGRMRELVRGRIWRQKTSDADAVDFARRKTWRHTDDNRLLPFFR